MEALIKKNIYELGFLVVPNLDENSHSQEIKVIKKSIEEINSNLISEGSFGYIDLEYKIFKKIGNDYKKKVFENAYFSWIKFEAETSKINFLKNNLDKNNNILRYLIIKTTKEDIPLTSIETEGLEENNEGLDLGNKE